MENKDRTLRTEKDLVIAKAKYKIAITEEMIEMTERNKRTCENHILKLKSDIEILKKGLLEMRFDETPKLSAKDFPCLDYYANRITFNDGKNMYTITEELKQIIPSPRERMEEIIDENIEIVECQLSEIKEGDYFCWDKKDSEDIKKYKYCTKTMDGILYYDAGHNGYIISQALTIRIHTDNKFVKFILRNDNGRNTKN